jgi:hypothetical protein
MSTETIPQPEAALTVTRNSLSYDWTLQDESERRCAFLRVGWTVRRAEIRTDDGNWRARRRGWRQVTAGDRDQPLVRLDPVAALVPGAELDAGWVITRNRRAYHGTLTRDGQTMRLRMPALSGRRIDVEVTGDWEQRDLVVLTACFALLARRRRDITIMVAAGSHGS